MELDITETLEPIRLLVHNQTHVLDGQILEDPVHISLHDAARQIPYVGGERWLARQRLPAAPTTPEITANTHNS